VLLLRYFHCLEHIVCVPLFLPSWCPEWCLKQNFGRRLARPYLTLLNVWRIQTCIPAAPPPRDSHCLEHIVCVPLSLPCPVSFKMLSAQLHSLVRTAIFVLLHLAVGRPLNPHPSSLACLAELLSDPVIGEICLDGYNRTSKCPVNVLEN
jgi:hypothetical protein